MEWKWEWEFAFERFFFTMETWRKWSLISRKDIETLLAEAKIVMERTEESVEIELELEWEWELEWKCPLT